MFKKRENVAEIEEGNLLSPKFDNDGLIPVITTDHQTNEVLMQGFMNEEALKKTIETKEAHYWSRSRKKVWHKGETSGFVQKVVELRIDDDVPLSQRTNDFILRSKINTRLLFKSGINSNNFSVDVVEGEVYIIGLADNINEKTEVERFLSGMTDIKKLITIIEIPKNLENE